jgi:hypothetical protein
MAGYLAPLPMSGLTSTPSSLEALPLLGDIPLELWDWNP